MDGRPNEEMAEITSQPNPVRPRNAWRRIRNILLFFVGLGATLLFGYWAYDRYVHININDARITADVVSVSSRLSGLVEKLHVSEGDKIKIGDILVSIDSRDVKLRIAELDARLSALESEAVQIKLEKKINERQTKSQETIRSSQLRGAKAVLAGRKSDLDLARIDFVRVKTLLKRKVVSRQNWEKRRSNFRKAEHDFQKAQAEVSASSASLLLAKADRQKLLVLDRKLTMLSHRKAEILAQRRRQILNLKDRTIRSPLNGVIDKTFVNSSEFVSAGQRLLMLHDPKKVWVSANIKETNIRHVQLQTPVKILVDAYPRKIFQGKISKIGNAATSEFALLPTPNPSGNFTKIVQRLRIRIDLDEHNGLLKPGMMVEVEIGIKNH
ncbi:MAG: HlyD family secretion protein [Pseudomonadota bacterium]|nr:HlyD family secretion protein [Pseudomonadota bacterium]